MPRKRTLLLALLGVAALATAGVAVAAATHATVASASATFSATTVSKSHTVTCTAKSGDKFSSTSATYKGTSTSQDARLNGPLTLRAHSFIDTTNGNGTVSGVYFIKGTGKANTSGSFSAAVSNGSASGLAVGVTSAPAGRLTASLGTSFSQAGGFTAGALGGPATGAGVVVASGYCPTKKK